MFLLRLMLVFVAAITCITGKAVDMSRIQVLPLKRHQRSQKVSQPRASEEHPVEPTRNRNLENLFVFLIFFKEMADKN